jgi:hypothetical protein
VSGRVRTEVMLIAKSCDLALEAYGVNDMISVSTRTAVQCTADRATIWDELKQAKVRVIGVTVGPTVTTTDNYATAANQSTKTGEDQRLLHNDDLRQNYVRYGLWRVFEYADTIEVDANNAFARGGGRIRATGAANGNTSDGLHYNGAGCALNAAGFDLGLLSGQTLLGIGGERAVGRGLINGGGMTRRMR